MVCVCRFDPNRDIKKVDQFGFVDLNECLANGEVPSEIADSEDQYNGIEDPAEILGKPADVFDAYRMGDYIKETGVIKDKGVTKETASAESK